MDFVQNLTNSTSPDEQICSAANTELNKLKEENRVR